MLDETDEQLWLDVTEERLRMLREMYAHDEIDIERLDLHVGQVLAGQVPTWEGLPLPRDSPFLDAFAEGYRDGAYGGAYGLVQLFAFLPLDRVRE